MCSLVVGNHWDLTGFSGYQLRSLVPSLRNSPLWCLYLSSKNSVSNFTVFKCGAVNSIIVFSTLAHIRCLVTFFKRSFGRAQRDGRQMYPKWYKYQPRYFGKKTVSVSKRLILNLIVIFIQPETLQYVPASSCLWFLLCIVSALKDAMLSDWMGIMYFYVLCEMKNFKQMGLILVII